MHTLILVKLEMFGEWNTHQDEIIHFTPRYIKHILELTISL